MKYLIVNGDDFGASHGINRGIIEAHQQGILTSTSLLVSTPWSEEAAGSPTACGGTGRAARQRNPGWWPAVDPHPPGRLPGALAVQVRAVL